MAMSETTSFFYDTHAAVHRLTTAGMPEPHAEAVVGEQVHLIQHNLATTADIETSRLETKAEIATVCAEIEKLRLATKADIEQIRADVEKRHLETKAEIVTAKHDLVKWIVTMNLTTAAVIVAVIKLI